MTMTETIDRRAIEATYEVIRPHVRVTPVVHVDAADFGRAPHASAFNLGILMRQVFGVGAPRRLQGQALDTRALEIALAMHLGLLPRLLRRHSALAIA